MHEIGKRSGPPYKVDGCMALKSNSPAAAPPPSAPSRRIPSIASAINHGVALEPPAQPSCVVVCRRPPGAVPPPCAVVCCGASTSQPGPVHVGGGGSLKFEWLEAVLEEARPGLGVTRCRRGGVVGVRLGRSDGGERAARWLQRHRWRDSCDA